MIEGKLMSGEIGVNELPKDVYLRYPEVQCYKLDSFRSFFNKIKTKHGGNAQRHGKLYCLFVWLIVVFPVSHMVFLFQTTGPTVADTIAAAAAAAGVSTPMAQAVAAPQVMAQGRGDDESICDEESIEEGGRRSRENGVVSSAQWNPIHWVCSWRDRRRPRRLAFGRC